MLKVVLFLILFNSQSGEVVATFLSPTEQNAKAQGVPGFRSVEECEAARDLFIAQNPAPEGTAQKGYCVEPKASTSTKL